HYSLLQTLLFSIFFLSPLLTLFFFTPPPPSALYTLSLHDALPICRSSQFLPRSRSSSPQRSALPSAPPRATPTLPPRRSARKSADRKSTRLNSSHLGISYAVFCLKKKKKKKIRKHTTHKKITSTTI